MLFGSKKKVDATSIADSSYSDLEFISTLDLSGLHRTNSEIAKMNGLTEYLTGANLRYSNTALKLGSAFVYQGFDRPYVKKETYYNQFDFRGNSNFSLSGDYNYTFKNINLFGEVSKILNPDIKNGLAMIHGAMISIDSRASVGVLYRNYSRDYQTFYN